MAKTNFNNTVSTLNDKVAINNTKNESIENEIKKLKTLNLSYFIGKSHFEEDGTSYLVFRSINNYFKLIANTDYVSSWESKGLSAETSKPPSASDNSLTHGVSYYGIKTRVKFTRSCLKQPKI